jgi:anti-anti-sigma factor
MHFELNEDGTGVVKAQGVLDARTATALRDALLRALDSASRVRIDMEGVESMDILCLQLVCSAMRTAAGLGKEIGFGEGSHEALDRAASEAGFMSMERCGG